MTSILLTEEKKIENYEKLCTYFERLRGSTMDNDFFNKRPRMKKVFLSRVPCVLHHRIQLIRYRKTRYQFYGNKMSTDITTVKSAK